MYIPDILGKTGEEWIKIVSGFNLTPSITKYTKISDLPASYISYLGKIEDAFNTFSSDNIDYKFYLDKINEMINKINERMNVLFGTNINKLYGPKNKKYKFIGWSGMTDIEKIYNGLYENSDLFLHRKKTIFDYVIHLINNKKKYRKK